MTSQNPRDEDFLKEIEGVKIIIKNFEKAEKGYVLYPPHSEILQGFINDLVNGLEKHLEEYPSVELTINSTDLICKGEHVYVNEDRAKSLSFRFYQSGLRTLGFHTGLEREEILDFMEILKHAHGVDEQEDDVVTLLWEKDCPHITYMTIDYFSDEESQEVVRKLAEVQTDPQMVASKIIRHITTSTIDVDKSFIPQEADEQKIEEDLYSLKNEELEALREKINWEKDYNPLYDFTSVLFKILDDQIPLEEFQDLARVVTSILQVMISKGYFRDCGEIIQKIRKFSQHPQMPPQRSEILRDQLEELSSAQTVREAGLYMKKAKKKEDVESICQFLFGLEKGALVSICNLFKDVEASDELLHTVERLTEDNINILFTKLHDSNLKIVMAMLKILARKQDPKIIREVLPLLKHKDASIRLEAIQTLSHFDSPQIRETFLTMIDDPHLSVKKSVLNQLIESGMPGMFEPLMLIIDQKEFLERDFFEKKALLITLAKSHPEKALPVLTRLLKTKSWLFKKDLQEETRQCAALALGETHRREAAEILQKFASDKSSELSNACMLALKKLVKK